MFKRKLTLFGPVFVLVSGLVSCGPKEKTTKDVYRAPMPMIRQGGAVIGFKSWEQVPKKDLDLTDAIDATGAKAAATEVSTSCRAGGQNYTQHVRVSGSPLLKIFQILPEEILPLDLAKVNADCTIKVTLFNDIESKHIIPEIQASILDMQPATAGLEADGAVINQALPQYRVSKLGTLRARAAADFSGQSQVICEDAATSLLASQSVIALADFDFQKMNNYSQRANLILESKPVQRCRVQFLRDKIAAALTAPFLLRFEAQALQASVSVLHHQGQPISPVTAAQTHTELMRLHVRNPSQGARTLIFSKGKVGATAASIMDPQVVGFNHPIAYVTAAPVANGQAQVREERDHYVIQLAPAGGFEIVVTHRGSSFRCSTGISHMPFNEPRWVAINTVGEIHLREISESGTELSSLAINVNQRFYFGHTKDTIDRSPVGHQVSISSCSWP